MSAAPARQHRSAPFARPATAPAPRRDHLRAVAAPEHSRSLVPLTWASVSIIIGALAAVLLLNTAMAEGAYERRDLKIEIAQLHQQRAALITELEANSSPHLLAKNAAALGMVHARAMGFISLEARVAVDAGGE